MLEQFKVVLEKQSLETSNIQSEKEELYQKMIHAKDEEIKALKTEKTRMDKELSQLKVKEQENEALIEEIERMRDQPNIEEEQLKALIKQREDELS